MSRAARMLLGVTAPRRQLTGGGDVGGGGPDIGTPLSEVRALYSGHSLLDAPPGMLHDIVAEAANGTTHEYERQHINGSPISIRSRRSGSIAGFSTGTNVSGDSLDLIAEMRSPASVSADYTHLVICERHDSVGVVLYEDTVKVLRLYHDIMRDASPTSMTYFYGSWWGGLNSSTAAAWVEHERTLGPWWEAIVSRIRDSLANESANPDSLQFLPANLAVAELVDQATTGTVDDITQGSVAATLALLFTDDVHLSTVGEYYVAMVLYSSLYRRTCVGLPTVSGVSTTQRDSLQALAWDFVSTYYSAHPTSPRHTFTERQAIATTHIAENGDFRGNTSSVASDTAHFTAATLDNQLYHHPSDASGYWHPIP